METAKTEAEVADRQLSRDRLWSKPSLPAVRNTLSTMGTNMRWSPPKFFLGLLAIVFLGESIVMFILPLIFAQDVPVQIEAVTDATLLTILISPAVWIIIVRPLRTIALQLSEMNKRLNTEIAERVRADERLIRERDFSDTVVESLPGIFFLFDESGKFLRWNQNLERVTGYSGAELAEMNPLDFASEKEKELFAAAMAKVFTEGEDLLEANLVTRDGREIPYYFNGKRIESDGKLHMLGAGIDLTERKILEEQLRQSQKMEAVGQLAGGVAHDFNNLLTVITGYSDLILRGVQNNPARRKIEGIKRAGERAANLTRQLLAFSRQQVLQPKVLDLNTVVADMDKMLRRLLTEDINVRTLLAPQLGRVKADPGQIEQVIMNLVVNARDAMPYGGHLTIETANVELDETYADRHIPTQPGSYVMLAVSDNGTGMDTQTLSHVFEPFFTTKGAGKGTGLGLSTVYGIVKQSGGNVCVYSEPGHGTTFKIYLPSVEARPETEGITIESPTLLPGTECILLVEDEEVVRDLAQEVLEGCGYRVLPAAGAKEALSLCESGECNFDLLLTDVIMPQMSGRELTDKLSEIFPDMNVLYMSGYTNDVIVQRGVINEVMNFIQKPFTAYALAKKVREVLDKSI